MQSGDLSTLFRLNPVGPALPATFRQGVLLDFDADDGSNSVGIGTSELTDLPLLVTGAEIGLEAGDNVLVMYLGNSAMIVGKIASVGGSNYGAGNSGHESLEVNALDFGVIGGAVTVICTDTLVAPGWAHSARVQMAGQASLPNGSGVADTFATEVRVSCPGITPDGWADSPAASVPSGSRGTSNVTYFYTQDITPGATLTFTYAVASGHTWPPDVGASANFWVNVDFYRE